jgi:hypothetical protein
MEAFLAYVGFGSLYRTTMSVKHQKFDRSLFRILSGHDDGVSNAVLSDKRVYSLLSKQISGEVGSIVSQRILQKRERVRFKLPYYTLKRHVACGAW